MKLLGLWVLPALFLSCASLPERPREDPNAFSKELRRQIVQELKRRNGRISGLRGMASVRYGSKVFGARGETAVLVKPPYYLRIDGLSDFGAYDSQVAVSNGSLEIYWTAENRYFKGLANREDLSRFLLVALNPEEVVGLLLGQVPIEDEDDYFLKEKATFFLRGERGDLLIVRREEAYLPVRYRALDVDGELLYTIHYEDYAMAGGDWFPQTIRADFRDPKSRVEIRYHDIEINPTPAIDKAQFHLKIPEDATELKD